MRLELPYDAAVRDRVHQLVKQETIGTDRYDRREQGCFSRRSDDASRCSRLRRTLCCTTATTAACR